MRLVVVCRLLDGFGIMGQKNEGRGAARAENDSFLGRHDCAVDVRVP